MPSLLVLLCRILFSNYQPGPITKESTKSRRCTPLSLIPNPKATAYSVRYIPLVCESSLTGVCVSLNSLFHSVSPYSFLRRAQAVVVDHNGHNRCWSGLLNGFSSLGRARDNIRLHFFRQALRRNTDAFLVDHYSRAQVHTVPWVLVGHAWPIGRCFLALRWSSSSMCRSDGLSWMRLLVVTSVPWHCVFTTLLVARAVATTNALCLPACASLRWSRGVSIERGHTA